MTAKYSKNYSARSLMLATAALALAGCGTTQYTQVRVPVPVECKEQVPDRPAMPTEALHPGTPPWVLQRASLAEIDRREGYELQLRAALVACTAPVVGASVQSPPK